MPLRRNAETLHLDAECGVDEALPLLEQLTEPDPPVVDMRGCTHMHTALVQVLAACRPHTLGALENAFLARWLMPLIASPPS